MSKIFISVAIPAKLNKLLTYSFQTLNANDKLIGKRVLVPFRKGTTVGIIIQVNTAFNLANSSFKVKEATKIIDEVALFPEATLKLLCWASEYYFIPLGMLCKIAAPFADLMSATTAQDNTTSALEICSTLKLNNEQQYCITQILTKLAAFNPILLYGITGSGKTLIYLHVIAKVLSQGKQALVLIPEINLTPQTQTRFNEFFPGKKIIVLNSTITKKRRLAGWIDARDGQADIVIGTRLAAFVPLKTPGVFIIDEEHDLSFKQQDNGRYNARDILIKRAQLENCPIILGSATPSAESWNNYLQKKFSCLHLNMRANQAFSPNIELVDVRHGQLFAMMSNEVLNAIRDNLAKNMQSFVFINRRGFAPVFMCYECGWHQQCKNCDANMVLHYSRKRQKCHHCNFTAAIPKSCPHCQSLQLNPVGSGTERIEKALKEKFPSARILRVDKDTVANKAALTAALSQINDCTVDIIVGTQMLAKGHDFKNLTLVSILDIDGALYSTDFRAIERMGQMLIQVAGRSGRSIQLGKVLVQTNNPQSIELAMLIKGDYATFMQHILAQRQAFQLPPYSYHMLLRAYAKQAKKVEQFLINVQNFLISYPKLVTLGPSAANIGRKKDLYQMQLTLQASHRGYLHKAIWQLLAWLDTQKEASSIKWDIDVDPLEVS